MYRNEEWKELLVDLIVHILLEFASPSMSVNTTVQTQYKTMHLRELCVSAEIAMEPLANLAAVQAFYEFLMKIR
eukprot:jgi/Pico_ML_1/53076/g3690.t1